LEIRLEQLSKEFADGSAAVHGLNLTIANRELLTLLGPSGCGKTTTLRMIAGLESPTRGRVYFGDRLMNEVPPAKRNIAMVFQSYALYPHMTVRGNMDYPLRKAGLNRADRQARIAQAAGLLQIDALLDRKPRQLSGGQQQRVALGRAIVRDPDVFLLDEPMSNLDAKLRGHMRVELIQLHRRLGKTAVYVTHDQMEAMTMSDRIAVLNRGLLQQVATPDEIYNRPANRFVANFIGSPEMNFIEGEIGADTDGICFRAASFNLPLSGDQAESARRFGAGRTVSAGLRPEDVMLGEGSLEGDVTVVESIGHEILVQLDVRGHRIVARVPAHLSIRSGSRVPIGFRSEKLHLFDGETGTRVRGA